MDAAESQRLQRGQKDRLDYEVKQNRNIFQNEKYFKIFSGSKIPSETPCSVPRPGAGPPAGGVKPTPEPAGERTLDAVTTPRNDPGKAEVYKIFSLIF